MQEQGPQQFGSISSAPQALAVSANDVVYSSAPKSDSFWHTYGKLVTITSGVLIIAVSILVALFTGAVTLTRKTTASSTQISSSYATQSIPLSGFAPLDDFGLSTSQSLSVNGQLYVNNSLILAPIDRPVTSQIGQLYFDRTANGISYYNGSEYLTVANSGQVQNLQVQLQSVDARITSLPAAPSIPSDLATLGADNLFQGSNTFIGGVNTGELRVDGVTVLGATTISNLLLSSPLSVPSGGTGATSLANNGVLIGQGTSPISAVTSATPGMCLMSTGGAPVFALCPGGSFSGVDSVNGLSGSLTLSNATANGTTLTVNDASATNKGIARFNSANFTVASGLVDTIQNIGLAATPTFAGVNVDNITSSGGLSITAGINSDLTLVTSGSGALSFTGYDCSASGGGGKLTVDANSRVICAADNDTPTPGDGQGVTTIGALDGGTASPNGANLSVDGSTMYLQSASSLRNGLVTTGVQTFGGLKTFANGLVSDGVIAANAGVTIASGQTITLGTVCGPNQVLTTDTGGVVTCGTDNQGIDTGVTNIGSIDTQPKSANGAVINGSTVYLQSADASSVGLVTTSAQTFAGAKTFNGLITANGSLAIAGGQTVTLGSVCGAGQVLSTNGSGVIMCVADGTGVDTGVTVVGALDNQPRSANGATIVGNSIYLQTADALNAGLISTGLQTLTGAKTFDSSVTTNGVFISTIANGTAPLTVASTTKVTNLNADLLDGFDSSAFGDATAANQTTILNRLGTNADAAGTGTVFARLASIDASKLGTTADTANATGTIFARFAELFGRIGSNSDASSVGTIFGRLAKILEYIGTPADAANQNGSIFAMLKYIANNLTGLGGKNTVVQEFTSTTSAVPAWSPGTTGGTGRSGTTAVTYNSKVYIWGGQTNTGSPNSMDIYDPATDTWSTGTAGGTGRYNYTAVVYNDKLYIWGGWMSGAGYTNVVDIYNFTTNTWSTGTAGGTARQQASAVVYNDKMYVWGGNTNASQSVNTMDIYNLTTNTWSTGTAASTGRYGHTAVLYGAKMYVWGGYNGSSYTNTMDIYDFTTSTWSAGTAGGSGRTRHVSAMYGTKMYVWSGVGNGGSIINSMDIYDFASNTWSTGPATDTAGRFDATAFISGNKMYVWGGNNSPYLNTMVIYNLDYGTVSQSGAGSWTAPVGVTSVKVLVVGAGAAGGSSRGGGGGEVVERTVNVTPGTSYDITIGLGGTSLAANGGTSSFGALLTALGGVGDGTAGNGTGSDGNGGGGAGGLGGNCSGGVGIKGYGGGGAGSSGTGTCRGSSGGGNGGANAKPDTGGGGGAFLNGNGKGANGYVRLTWEQ